MNENSAGLNAKTIHSESHYANGTTEPRKPGLYQLPKRTRVEKDTKRWRERDESNENHCPENVPKNALLIISPKGEPIPPKNRSSIIPLVLAPAAASLFRRVGISYLRS